jgi:hypothetical protein
MNVEIGAEAALFPEKEYISGIFVAVWITVTLISGRMDTRIRIHPITGSQIHLSLDEWVYVPLDH